MVEQIMQRLKLLFGMGTATRVETDIIQVNMATGIVNDRIKRLHNYGFMSRPLPKSKAYLFFIGGDTSRGVAMCVEDDRYQMDLQPGEVAIIDDKENLIHFTSNGIKIKTNENVEIEASKNVTITCENATINATKSTINAETEINGNITINGDATVTGMCAVGGISSASGGSVPAVGGLNMINGDITADGISLKGHTHSGDSGGTTGTAQ